MQRRDYLALASVPLVGGLAGCTGGGGDDDDGDEPIELTHGGNGSDVVSVDVERRGPTVVAMQHDGRSTFRVELLDSSGQRVASLADETGRWAGAAAAAPRPGEHRLDVETDGLWEVTIVQHPEYADGEVRTDFPVGVEGNSDDVYGPLDLSSPRTITWNCWGDGTNVVRLLDAGGQRDAVLLDTVGSATGGTETSTSTAVGWVDTEMSGAFEMEIAE